MSPTEPRPQGSRLRRMHWSARHRRRFARQWSSLRPNRIGLGGLALLAAVWLPAALEAQATNISLAGTWRFALGSRQALGKDEIYLPGTTDLAGYGDKTKGPEAGWLSRPYSYQEAAWYEKNIVVPEAWRGQPISLFLERAHWQTQVWVDDKPFGTQNS